jgi:hypothetical protein
VHYCLYPRSTPISIELTEHFPENRLGTADACSRARRLNRFSESKSTRVLISKISGEVPKQNFTRSRPILSVPGRLATITFRACSVCVFP